MRVMLDYRVSPRDRASIQARLGLRDKNNMLRRYLRVCIKRLGIAPPAPTLIKP